MKISSELIQGANQYLNPIKERELDLRGYKLSIIENMGATLDQFDAIDFSDNEITKLVRFSTLKRLKTLILNNNKVSKIQNISESAPNLENLMLMNNQIKELVEIDHLSGCKNLRRLSLANNVVAQTPDYRLYVISRIPSLKVLDFQKVKQQEREKAVEKFGKPAEETGVESEAAIREKLRIAIENATSLEEINRIEALLKASAHNANKI